jgi:hypothetical protein
LDIYIVIEMHPRITLGFWLTAPRDDCMPNSTASALIELLTWGLQQLLALEVVPFATAVAVYPTSFLLTLLHNLAETVTEIHGMFLTVYNIGYFFLSAPLLPEYSSIDG